MWKTGKVLLFGPQKLNCQQLTDIWKCPLFFFCKLKMMGITGLIYSIAVYVTCSTCVFYVKSTSEKYRVTPADK